MFDQELQELKDKLIDLASDMLLKNLISSPIYKSFFTEINYSDNTTELIRIGTQLSDLSIAD